MRIYMDVCCLNRPFDDLSQDRVQLESNAILTILSRCESREWTLVSSKIVEFELRKLKNAEKLKKIQALNSIAGERLIFSEKAKAKSEIFQQSGIKTLDSLHLAVAESGGIDVFLTTDDALLRIANKIQTKIVVANPVTWLMEVLQNEHGG